MNNYNEIFEHSLYESLGGSLVQHGYLFDWELGSLSIRILVDVLNNLGSLVYTGYLHVYGMVGLSSLSVFSLELSGLGSWESEGYSVGFLAVFGLDSDGYGVVLDHTHHALSLNTAGVSTVSGKDHLVSLHQAAVVLLYEFPQ
jgi:hypothetical protein